MFHVEHFFRRSHFLRMFHVEHFMLVHGIRIAETSSLSLITNIKGCFT